MCLRVAAAARLGHAAGGEVTMRDEVETERRGRAPRGYLGATDASGRPLEATLVDMVFPEQTNHYGTLFGGVALALMDKAAFVVASRYARRSVVTACSERINFERPIREGHLVEAHARLVETGRTSITVEVELWGEDLLSGDRWLSTTGRMVMVALDSQGQPTPVPSLRLEEMPGEGGDS